MQQEPCRSLLGDLVDGFGNLWSKILRLPNFLTKFLEILGDSFTSCDPSGVLVRNAQGFPERS